MCTHWRVTFSIVPRTMRPTKTTSDGNLLPDDGQVVPVAYQINSFQIKSKGKNCR